MKLLCDYNFKGTLVDVILSDVPHLQLTCCCAHCCLFI